jgi:KUP system potassium uptake protein
MIIADPSAVEHPFFLMAPRWALFPLVGLATAATVIASQAVISGAFSLTRQAVRLGYLPRLKIEHTSESQIGQIYMPAVNWALMFACIGLVLGFRTSGRLAAAYGVAVTTDMVFTTILFAVVARVRFGWNAWVVGLLSGALLLVDLAFWSANLPKVPHGGWFPLLVAAVVFTLMVTWKKGRELLAERLGRDQLSTGDFLKSIGESPPPRVTGTAVFMTSSEEGVPRALLHNVKHNRILHERVILFTVKTLDVPYVADESRVFTEDLGDGFRRVVARYGFKEHPDVPAAMRRAKIPGYEYREMENSFFFGELTLVVSDHSGMARWRALLFERMTRNAQRASAFFNIPPNRVVGMGSQVEM